MESFAHAQTEGRRVSFDTLAPFYRPLEAILAGRVLQTCRTSYVSETFRRRRALILGEGPGRFLTELLRSSPGIEVTVIEQSPKMIREALRRIQAEGFDVSRVDFREMDALTWKPPDRVFDLIVTHFFLDCFGPTELADLVGRLGAGATDDALWLLGDFCIPGRGWRRLRARAIHETMYACFRATTGISAKRLTPPDKFLEEIGFQLVNRRFFNFGLIHSDLWVKPTP